MNEAVLNERRLSKMEQQLEQNSIEHATIMKTLDDMDKKLDNAIACKADKSEVTRISNRMWGFMIAIILALIGFFFFVIEEVVKKGFKV